MVRFSLISLLLLVSLVGSFWTRAAGAGSDSDFGRIRAMFQYVAAAILAIPAGYLVLNQQSVPLNLEVLSLNILLLLLAAVLVPSFNVLVVAAVGSLIVLLDPNNQLSTSLFILPAFVIPVLAGSILGSALFRQFFGRRMRAAVRDDHYPAAG